MTCDLDNFVSEALPSIQKPFALITTDGDASVPGDIRPATVQALLANPFLRAWHTQNFDGQGPTKIVPFPIGIDLHTPRPFTNPRKLVEQLRSFRAQRLPITQAPLRVLCDIGLQLASADRRQAIATLRDCGHVDFVKARLSQTQIWRRYASYPFVLSAVGNGLDCHRTWELLYLGCIVITRKSSLDPLFEGLPVVLLDDWSEVLDHANLSRWLREFGGLTDERAIWDRLDPKRMIGAIRRELANGRSGAGPESSAWEANP